MGKDDDDDGPLSPKITSSIHAKKWNPKHLVGSCVLLRENPRTRHGMTWQFTFMDCISSQCENDMNFGSSLRSRNNDIDYKKKLDLLNKYMESINKKFD